MIALGTLLVAALGFVIGWRGTLASLLLGLTLTIAIAVLQYVLLHPAGAYDVSRGWPWGASSIIAYVLALAAGLLVSLRR